MRTTKLKIQADHPIADYTTLGVGAFARFFLQVETRVDLEEALDFARKNRLPIFILGRGSNTLLVEDFNGLVIQNRMQECRVKDCDVYVSSGYSFSLLGIQTAKSGLSGLEFASGIPGSVGGALAMNAGANGCETCETLVSVEWMDFNGSVKTLSKEELDFSYRSSSFQKMKGCILGAHFRLKKDENARKRQLEIFKYRNETQPYGDKSAGCIFKNPEGLSAGALIEKAGLKGVSVGGAEVSTIHANFIVNRDNATAENIRELAKHVRDVVLEKCDVKLELELRGVNI